MAKEVWLAVDWFLPESLSTLRLGPAEYAGIMTFVAPCVVIVLYSPVNSLRPSIRFVREYESIVKVRDKVKNMMLEKGLDSWLSYYEDIAEVHEPLRRYGIKSPKFDLQQNYPASIWFSFLARTAAFAEAGNLRDARKYASTLCDNEK